MKRWSTTPVSASLTARATAVACAVLMAVSLPIQMNPTAYADSYDERINALEAQVDSYNSNAADLDKEAKTYEAEVARLNSQIESIQVQIDLAKAKHDKYVAQIQDSEEQIEQNKLVLGNTIANMYIESEVSTLEMVASSKNIGDFLDKQTQRQAIQDDLSKTVKKIQALKKELEKQKLGVEREMLNQQSAQDLLDEKRAEQAELVSETRGKESKYRSMAKEKSSQVDKLRAEQAAAIRRAAEAAARESGGVWTGVPSGIPGGGGYPGVWANAPIDAYVDPWGLYTRECVSYTAWKVDSTGRFVPHFGGMGNANQWPATTARHGIPNGSTPKKGSVAIMMSGPYGHSMYVEAVHGDGTITVSDYNYAWDGLYRTYDRPANGLIYIYF